MTPGTSTLSYVPDDAGITLKDLEFLHTLPGTTLRQAVLELLGSHGTPTVADIACLRKTYPPHAIHAALTIGNLQAKARLKFPSLNWCWCVPEALEQTTSLLVARHKAARFAALLRSGALPVAPGFCPDEVPIFDLCSGLGGDALALAQVAPTTAIDLSPTRLACLRLNAESAPPKHPLQTQCADITSPTFLSSLFSLPSSALLHIDPARRFHGKRSPKYADLIPGPPFLQKLLEHSLATALKLSPAVDFDSLPTGHLELISERRTVVQAVLWCGGFTETLPPHLRTATILSDSPITNETRGAMPSGVGAGGGPLGMFAEGLLKSTTAQSYSLTAAPRPVTVTSQVDAFLHEIDGTLTRANLAAEYADRHHLHALTIDGGYLTGSSATPLPAAQTFRVLEALRYSERRILEALRRHVPLAPTGPVEVKTRGIGGGGRRAGEIDTDQLQRHWSKQVPAALTVLIYRDAQNIRQAILAQRL